MRIFLVAFSAGGVAEVAAKGSQGLSEGIKIPPGVEAGALLKVSLKGKDSYGEMGDNLYLKVKIVED